MYLADSTTVDAVLAITLVLAIHKSTGTLLPGIQAILLKILEALTSSCVLDMPFLFASSPVNNWAGHFVALGSLVVMCLP